MSDSLSRSVAILITVIISPLACSSPGNPQEPIVIVIEEDNERDKDLGVTRDQERGELGPDADQALAFEEMDQLPDQGRCRSDAPGAWEDRQTPAFKDVTDEARFEALGVVGTRLAVSDLNGDGWPDLVVRRATDRAREHDFADGGVKQVWLLINDQQGSFIDQTRASNVLARRDGVTEVGRPAEIFVFADVDHDGDVDLYTAFSNAEAEALHPETAEIMLNQGDGTFELGDASHPLRVEALRPFSRGGAAFTDFDRDGKIDLWVGSNGGQDQLYRGDGQGRFTEVTAALGLKTEPQARVDDLNAARAHTNSWAVAACDLSNNGHPELLSSSYGRAPNHLWRYGSSLQSGAFYTNRSIASGYAFDDRQQWRDNESARCHCKLNPEDAECQGVPEPRVRCTASQGPLRWNHVFDREPFRLGGNSGTTLCADLNNDGWLDLLTAEIRHWDVGESSDPTEILLNTGDPAVIFERPGNEVTGLERAHNAPSWDEGDITAASFDFDNDGRLDLYIGSTSYPGTRGWLYHQRQDGVFEAVPTDVGVDHKSSHGLAVADFDRDGDLDLAVGHARDRCSSGDHCYESAHVRMFENTLGNQNNWVQLDLEGGEDSNRDAIGARITVVTDELTQTHDIGGGHGHYGIQHERVAHFGLGRSCAAEVTIQWPDRARSAQTVTLQAGHRYHIVQGEDPVTLD